MKKRIGLFIGVFLFISISAHAKSDFQFYAPLLSFFFKSGSDWRAISI